jgi:LCP family protein required for cell wall assembly
MSGFSREGASFTSRRVDEKKKTTRTIPWASLASAALRVKEPLLGWYVAFRERHQEEEKEKRNVRILKKLGVIGLSIVLGFVILAGTAKALVAMNIISLNTFFTVAGSDLPADENGNTNVLLLGKGDDSHDGIDLTDTIMVASFEPKRTKSVILLSIPRDLYIRDAKGMHAGRINDLYRVYKSYYKRQGSSKEEASQKAMKDLAKEIGDRLNLPIHHVVMVDFIGFVQAVDALGGVDIEVPETLIDPEYPGPNYTYQTFAIQAGLQHLDGETALKYARSRHSTSDFSRSGRQQQVLSALAQKAKDLGIIGSTSRMGELWQIISDHSETTMSFGEMVSMAGMGKAIEKDRILSVQLNNDTTSGGGFLYAPPREEFGGASVLLPLSIPALPHTWRQIETFTTILFQHRSIYLVHPQIAILNAGAKSGAAGMLGEELSRYNFEIYNTQNYSGEDLPQSTVMARTEEDKNLATFFATLLQLPVSVAPVGAPFPEELGQVTIFLGQDYTYKPIQDLLPTL